MKTNDKTLNNKVPVAYRIYDKAEFAVNGKHRWDYFSANEFVDDVAKRQKALEKLGIELEALYLE